MGVVPPRPPPQDECLKLGRHVAKLALVVAEVELTTKSAEKLRGEAPPPGRAAGPVLTGGGVPTLRQSRCAALPPAAGSQLLFQCLESLAAAMKQAEQLVEQCAATAPATGWPLEVRAAQGAGGWAGGGQTACWCAQP